MAKIFFLIILFSFKVQLIPQELNLPADSSLIINDTTKIFPNDTTLTDTTGLVSTEKNVVKDTIAPLNPGPLFSNSYFISRHEIERLNYRYAGEILNLFGFNYIKDLGLIGQPSESVLYGGGFNAVSYFSDGVLINNRYLNSLNLINIQTERIDSIEIVPSPRGFLYGAFNNPVSINFISKDFLAVTPYSRLKYYEGPEGEAFIDGYFSSLFFDRLIATVEVTNRKVDQTYTNSEFSLWQGMARLKYFLSNKINITGTYSYVDYEIGFNGGVDVDSLLKITNDFEPFIFTTGGAFRTPVKFPNQSLNTLKYKYDLKLVSELYDESYSDLSIYYYLIEDKILESSAESFKNNNKIFGISSRNSFPFYFLNAEVNGTYENTGIIIDDFTSGYTSENIKMTNYSLSGILSAELLDKNLVASAFLKYTGNSIKRISGKNSNNFSGFGFDGVYKYQNNLKFYFGYSQYEAGENKNFIKNLEAAVMFDSKVLKADLKYFRRNDFNFFNNFSCFYFCPDTLKDVSGVSANISFSISKILLETKTAYYDADERDKEIFPEVLLNAGIYYKDILFSSNLDLKTGFVFSYWGKRKFNSPPISEVPSSYRVDFTVAGKIQDAAILYFTWENLTDEDYYIIPFYPMPERNIRFGVAWEIFN